MVVIPGRQQAKPEKSFALFLIGMRINNLLAAGKWLPVIMAMPPMQAELRARPDAGLLWQRNFFSGRCLLTLQYWDSADRLVAYAHDRQGRHFPAWAAYNRKIAGNRAVGIWHETYVITPDMAENIYTNMPAFGLGGAIGVSAALARMGGSSLRSEGKLF